MCNLDKSSYCSTRSTQIELTSRQLHALSWRNCILGIAQVHRMHRIYSSSILRGAFYSLIIIIYLHALKKFHEHRVHWDLQFYKSRSRVTLVVVASMRKVVTAHSNSLRVVSHTTFVPIETSSMSAEASKLPNPSPVIKSA